MELFPLERKYPPGFSYEPNFLNQAEEHQLIDFIQTIDLHKFVFQGYEAKRMVASFGYDYNFADRKLKKGEDIPREFDPLIQKVSVYSRIAKERFAELLITKYPVGSVINWHRDAPPFEVIAGISLASVCTFRLRQYKKDEQTRRSSVSIPLERRSLYVISGESRAFWEHSTTPVKEVRYSITLRTLSLK